LVATKTDLLAHRAGLADGKCRVAFLLDNEEGQTVVQSVQQFESEIAPVHDVAGFGFSCCKNGDAGLQCIFGI
jgi:hypothetical protein